MSRYNRVRVTVDFFDHERDVLQNLCEQDIRPPQEQIRWLVLNEAIRRGVQPPTATNNKPVAKSVYEAEMANGFVQKPITSERKHSNEQQ